MLYINEDEEEEADTAMNRGEFLASSAAAAVAASDPFHPVPGTWRTYRVTTALTLAPGGAAQAWVPVPSFVEASWMTPGASTWHGNAQSATLAHDARSNAAFVNAQWPASSAPRTLTIVSTVTTRDRAVDLARPHAPEHLSAADRERYLASSTFIPTDGIVLQTAQKITGGVAGDTAKAHAIYDWIVANCYRKASVRGCGLGDVAFLLESGDLGGKCADLNGLAVGLARASGIPARDIYGLRVAPSRFGYKSLGANSPTITKAQHCRAELYLADYGWVPFDPADVRKVMLEEPPGNLPADNPKVVDARETLFGAWEGNYMAYNDAHDVALPGSSGKPVPFLMYPQAEIDGRRLDSLDPATFAYAITVAPFTAAS